MNGMGRRSHLGQLARTDIHGSGLHRYGVLGCLDVNLLRGGNMWIVVSILIITVILWWPRKPKGE